MKKVGEPVAKKMFKRLPARPLRGRWGSMFAAETDLMSLGVDRLLVIFNEAFIDSTQANKNKKKRKTEDDDDQGMGRDIDEEHEHFTEKRSRWVKEAMAALQDPNFKLIMHCGHTSRIPTEHCRCLFQKRATNQHESLNEWFNCSDEADRDYKKKPSAVLWVCQDVKRIANQWNEILAAQNIEHYWGLVLEIQDADTRATWIGFGVLLTLGQVQQNTTIKT